MYRIVLVLFCSFSVSLLFAQKNNKIREGDAQQKVVFRCGSSIKNYQKPLFVIDGVVTKSSDIENIDPHNIENISVLKDVSATAIYGSRGLAGVILITMKKEEIVEEEVIVTTEKISVFPNPTKGDLKLKGNVNSYILMSGLGEEVGRGNNLTTDQAEHEISNKLGYQEPGIYLLKVAGQVVRIIRE